MGHMFSLASLKQENSLRYIEISFQFLLPREHSAGKSPQEKKKTATKKAARSFSTSHLLYGTF